MPIYKIILTPLDSFFFGGSHTYNQDKRPKKYKKNKQNYFTVSELFPQQSAILGMLRYQILLQNNLTDEGSKTERDTEAHIGEKGFNGKGDSQNYGKIKNLSPVFLTNKIDNLISASLDFNFTSKERQEIRKIEPNFEATHQQIFHGWADDWDTAPDTGSTFEVKNSNPSLLTNSDSSSLYLIEHNSAYDNGKPKKFNDIIVKNGIFRSSTKIGIDKENTSNALYKQTRYYLEKDWGFAFFVETDEAINKSIVYLGAERSAFLLESSDPIDNTTSVKQTFDDTFKETFSHLNHSDCIILTSDAFVSVDQIMSHSRFCISATKDYRAMPDNYKSLTRSEQYVLMSRGSVIYPKSTFNPNSIFEIPGGYQEIGYNYFIHKSKNQ